MKEIKTYPVVTDEVILYLSNNFLLNYFLFIVISNKERMAVYQDQR